MTGLTGSGFEVKEETTTWSADGDHERYAHYVTQEDMMEAYVNGNPVMALCGKIWVPSKDPDKFPVCPTCKELYAELKGD